MEIIFKVVAGTDSVGSALRCFDVDEIQTDFVLISADVISNMKLDKVFEKHKRLRKSDSSVIMTSIFKKAAPHHRSRAGEDATILAVNKRTDQLLHLDNKGKNEIYLDTDLFKSADEIQIRYDLIDCRIDICSPQVICLFQDEFDWKGLFLCFSVLFSFPF